MRISFEEISATLSEILTRYGFTLEKSGLIADVFARSSLDGVYSHGLNRFPRFIENLKDKVVNPEAEPIREAYFGSLERWNGNLGAGILNALHSMKRASAIASESGIGCVSMANTNHWMRGGTYGWLAADMGYIGICWTNTSPNMVAWGSQNSLLGNNPLVIGIPRTEGHIVLDMALSQYSYGRIQNHARKNQDLPFPGGFDERGNLTTNPAAILNTEKTLPIGYWKGSALSFVLDLIAAMLSLGDPTIRIGKRKTECGLSQVFIAINIQWLDPDYLKNLTDEVVKNLQIPNSSDDSGPFYPGENTHRRRIENQRLGVPVEPEIWNAIKQL